MQTDLASKCGGKRLKGIIADGTEGQPLITVITVVFNGAKDLEPTILSVLNQSYANVEYIVIDGGSTDGTLDLLRKYENSIDFWLSEPDSGVYDAFNKACHLITGEWTIFLGAGDVFHNTKVLSLISEVMHGVSIDTEIIYGKVCHTSGGTLPVETFNWPWSQMRNRWRNGRPMLPHHQGVFHRKHVLSIQAPFDTSYRIAADSKLLYCSIRRAQPVFADAIVTIALLGGISTDPKYFMAAANEVIRVNREFGFTNYRQQLWCYLKAVSKSAIYKLGGDAICKLCVDNYRWLTGRERMWRNG